jgi:DNA-binding MarR family transcriptional regulator
MSKLKDEIRKRRDFDSLSQEVFLNLLRTMDVLARQFEVVFKPVELSDTQYNVLRILRGAASQGLACGEIAQQMITRDPDMTRLLDRLESRGLIGRSRESSDRRVVRTRITEAGLALLAQLDEPIRHLHERQLAHMSRDDLTVLLRLLEAARSGSS